MVERRDSGRIPIRMLTSDADDGWIKLEGEITPDSFQKLVALGRIEQLSVANGPKATAKAAQEFRSLASVRHLWLWREVTRTAMRHVVSTRGLEVLDVLSIEPPGRLDGFSHANDLREFRCNCSPTELDLLEIASCRTLNTIGAQGANLTSEVIEAFLEMPALRSLDLEASTFDDGMAARLSASDTLLSLDVGNTKLTRSGLSRLCTMKNLKSLDLWATAICEGDIDLLANLPNLEYLSIGGVEGGTTFNAETLVPRLQALGSLERIWLDGVRIGAEQRSILEARYKVLRIT